MNLSCCSLSLSCLWNYLLYLFEIFSFEQRFLVFYEIWVRIIIIFILFFIFLDLILWGAFFERFISQKKVFNCLNISILMKSINEISLHNWFWNFLFFAQRSTVRSTPAFLFQFFTFFHIIISISITFFNRFLALFRRMSSILYFRIFGLRFLTFIVTLWWFFIILGFEIEVI